MRRTLCTIVSMDVVPENVQIRTLFVTASIPLEPNQPTVGKPPLASRLADSCRVVVLNAARQGRPPLRLARLA